MYTLVKYMYFEGSIYVFLEVILFFLESYLLLCVFGQIPDTFCFLFSKGALLRCPQPGNFFKDFFFF